MKLRKIATIATIGILSFTAITACANVNSNTTDNVSTTSSQNKSTKANVYVENGIAIRGIDPVAYFKESQAVKGSEEYSYQWNNATWRFASAENRDLFASNPDRYAPQYGGFCAWAVSQGYTAPIDPEAWKIVDDKLYLNYSKRVQKTWEKYIPGNIAKADRNWPGVLNK